MIMLKAGVPFYTGGQVKCMGLTEGNTSVPLINPDTLCSRLESLE